MSFPNANDLVKCFVKHKLLTEIAGQVRNRRCRYAQ